MKANRRVMVAMSGGVDSALAAALLKEQGYEVIGVTMRLWTPPGFEEESGHAGRGCCSLSAVEDARRVAEILSIPFYVLNFKDAFREKVVDYFVAEYRRGRTPNPCIACNRWLKFDLLLRKALELGCRYLATGHYARVRYDSDKDRWLLAKAADAAKDQTYALYSLTQKQLAHTLFPLGSYRKDEVRELAAGFGLRVAGKPDSQEVCFIPDDDYRRFLREEAGVEPAPGPIFDLSGRQVGVHQGLPFYTVGQRKGLGLASGRPLYVVEMDFARNALIVGEHRDVFSGGLLAEDLNLIAVERLEGEVRLSARVRYHGSEAKGVLAPLVNGRVRFDFDLPERAVTPGQAVVFYDGELVAGGAVIEKALAMRETL
jgi:tRNA-specific 2-thiouridylase